MKYKKTRPWVGKTRITKQLEDLLSTPSETIYIEAQNNHHVHFVQRKKLRIPIRGRMMDIMMLLDPEIFMRIHESFAINKDHVLDKEKRGDGLTVMLTDEVTALVSELYTPTFNKWFRGREKAKKEVVQSKV